MGGETCWVLSIAIWVIGMGKVVFVVASAKMKQNEVEKGFEYLDQSCQSNPIKPTAVTAMFIWYKAFIGC